MVAKVMWCLETGTSKYLNMKTYYWVLILGVIFVQTASAQTTNVFRSSEGTINEKQQVLLEKIQSRVYAKSVSLIRFDDALSIKDKSFLSFNLPNRGALQVEREKQFMGYDDKFSWRGVPPSYGATVKLDVNNGNVIGVIQTKDFHYTIEPLGGGLHALIEIDHSKFNPDGEPILVGDGPIAPNENKGGKGKIGMYTVLSDPVVDVLVAYTTNAKNAAYDIEAIVTSAAGLANDSFSNSLISASINLVHMLEVTYAEADSLEEDINRLMLSNDNHIDNIHTYRDFFGADVVVLIVDSDDNLCGLGYQGPSQSAFAMAVVQYDCAVSGFTFAHEIGHVIGAGHDAQYNEFQYGHGYVYTTGNWRTIMARNNVNPEPRILYWSNPDKLLTGIPMGTYTDEDNARVWDERASTVEAFRSAVTPPGAPSVTIDGPTLMLEFDTETFDADVTGGGTPLSYQWYYKHDTDDLYWSAVGFNASYYNHTAGSPDAEWLKVVVTDAIWRTAEDDIFINVLGLGKQVAEEDAKQSPNGFLLEQNYPNPFNPSTTISFSIPEASDMSLDVYDVMGRHVATLFNGMKQAGIHEVKFDATSLSSGIYITRLKATGSTGQQFTKDIKMNLVK